MSIKTYSGMLLFSSFEERFEYLSLLGLVGDETFGGTRYLNQQFYRSPEWRKVRRDVILRDEGRDLAIAGREIQGPIIVHHIMPVSIDDVKHGSRALLDPNNLVCVSKDTHNALHYGDFSSTPVVDIVSRRPNDTCPWKDTL